MLIPSLLCIFVQIHIHAKPNLIFFRFSFFPFHLLRITTFMHLTPFLSTSVSTSTHFLLVYYYFPLYFTIFRMAISDIEAVLQFLRKNGFSDSESALMEDIIEKSHLGSSEFEKFFFPLVPPPPRLKIRRPPVSSGRGFGKDDDRCSKVVDDDSDEDEFVSLCSSTSEFHSSEFTNPNGIHSNTKLSSRSSSDNLSQFGTARDSEFDMQNDLSWYKDSDEEYVPSPGFGVLDYDEGPSEDKFVTTVESGELSLQRMINDKKRAMNSIESMSDAVIKDYYDSINHEGYNVDCCGESGSNDHRVLADHGFVNFKETEHGTAAAFISRNLIKNNFNSVWFGDIEIKDDFEPVLVEDVDRLKENKSHECGNNPTDEEPFDPDRETDDAEVVAASDEVKMFDTNEDDYEVFNLKIIHRKNRTGFEENKEFPIVENSIIASRYYVTEYIGSAAFSKVIRAHDLYNGNDVCLKIIKNDKDFFDQSLDEIKLLKLTNKYDPGDERHILRLYDYFYHQEHLFIVCELLRVNLYEFLKYNQESGGDVYFTLARLQVITRQCLEALEYLHGLGIIHCDLKPENILFKSYRRCEIKIIDLGSSCFQTDKLTLYVQSRSYRAPEVILGLPYDQRIDLWSLGCILAELYSGEVLFPNEAIAMLLARVISILGPVDLDMLESGQETHKYFTEEYDLYLMNEETNELDYIIPAEPTSLEHHLQIYDPLFLDFLSKLLEINPQRRLTAREALEHPWLAYPYEPSTSGD